VYCHSDVPESEQAWQVILTVNADAGAALSKRTVTTSFKDLMRSLIEVLKGVGSKYQIDFAH
jgi:adenine C2-methylase RlmN of 23S rRNA A2503 and tRNA A37